MIDDTLVSLPNSKGGRPSVLKDSEVITILVFNILTVQQKTLRQIYDWIHQYHSSEFPKMPNCHPPHILNTLSLAKTV